MHRLVRKLLFPKAIINSVVNLATTRVSALQVTIGSMVWGFSRLAGSAGSDFPMINFDDILSEEYLLQLQEKLEKLRDKEEHRYKKLHYTLVLSKLHDQKVILEKKCQKEDMLGLLNSVIVPGDIMLVSYEAGGKGFNRAFNKAVSKLLQLFSHSVFSHVGVVGLKTDNNGFDRVHSTLDNSGGRSGVKRENLTQYLEKRRPSTILVVRPSYSSEEKKEEFLERAYLHVKNKVEYDTSDAISDITGLTLWRDDTKFNCGELVYDCIRSIIKDFSLEQGSIPVSYLKHELFTPVYLTDI